MIKTAAVPVSRLPNIHSLSEEERKALVRRSFMESSRFEQKFRSHAADLDCGAFSQVMHAEVLRLLSAKGIAVPEGKLEELHNHIPQDLKDYNYDDGVNRISTYLYDTDIAFIKEYHRFIKGCIASYFPYPFYFQATPTIRIQCPGGINSNHYPRYHTDIGYGHPPQEINIWLPLTAPVLPQYHGFRLMDVESSHDLMAQFNFEFAPFINRAINDKSFDHALDKAAPQVTTPLGKMFAFDSRCVHTGEALERHTRASIDIRIIPLEDYKKLTVEYQGTGRRKVHFVPGQGYYHASSDEL